MMDKSDAVAKMEEATEQLQEWKEKLEAFNKKVPKPEIKTVEIIQEDDSTIPHIDLKGQKKTEDKEIVADNTIDGFDPDEVMFDMVQEPEVDKDKQLEEFKKREAEEKQALEEFARKAREEEITATVEEALKMHESESVMTPIEKEPTISERIQEAMEPERTRPDFTEVIEPEAKIEKPKDIVKNSKPRVMRTIKPTEVRPPKPILSNWQRAELLDNFHKEHGNFEDVKEYVQNEEQNEKSLWNKSKNMTSETDYHGRMEQRINDLMSKIEKKEIKLEDLSQDDQRVINEINNQKNDG